MYAVWSPERETEIAHYNNGEPPKMDGTIKRDAKTRWRYFEPWRCAKTTKARALVADRPSPPS